MWEKWAKSRNKMQYAQVVLFLYRGKSLAIAKAKLAQPSSLLLRSWWPTKSSLRVRGPPSVFVKANSLPTPIASSFFAFPRLAPRLQRGARSSIAFAKRKASGAPPAFFVIAKHTSTLTNQQFQPTSTLLWVVRNSPEPPSTPFKCTNKSINILRTYSNSRNM